MKKGKIKKFLKWFFEEEKSESSKEADEDTIEISFFQLGMIVIVMMLFLFWIFGSYLESHMRVPVLSPQEHIEKNIEKDYFEKEDAFKNGDFSDGLKHWVSSDGGKVFPESKSIINLEKNDYHSAPYCIRIESISPANRMHYSKKKKQYTIQNAYGYKETNHWLGVLPGSVVKASLWYKGDIPRLSIIGLNHEGEWSGLTMGTGPRTKEWRQIEVSTKVPELIRAIALEITLNQAEGMALPVILIDDVNIKVEKNNGK